MKKYERVSRFDKKEFNQEEVIGQDLKANPEKEESEGSEGLKSEGKGKKSEGSSDYESLLKQLEEDNSSIQDNRIIPKLNLNKYEEKPLVVVIDDDFTVLDIMKIYLSRDYTYKGFTNAKDAVFYVNDNAPSLIFVDSYMTMLSTKKIISILRSYEYIKKVPIYYICDESERAALKKRLVMDEVDGIITRPVARGKLQEVLDEVFVKEGS
ncbi:MAG: response regulator [Lachnospiraceae bacterium]|nr:response regulator [Lachnospiraceae bacterium]